MTPDLILGAFAGALLTIVALSAIAGLDSLVVSLRQRREPGPRTEHTRQVDVVDVPWTEVPS